jgi:hypothetical protein
MRELIRRRRREQIAEDVEGLLTLKRPFGIEIITPRELLTRLARHESS